GRPDRTVDAGHADPDVRWWHQRGAARPDRPVRTGTPARPAPLGEFMDFALSEEQQAMVDLAGRILSEQLPPERVRSVETDPDGRWFAEDVWAALAKADLLGLCLPEAEGGGGFGFLEAALL